MQIELAAKVTLIRFSRRVSTDEPRLRVQPLTKIIPVAGSGSIEQCDILILDPSSSGDEDGAARHEDSSGEDELEAESDASQHRLIVRLRLPQGILKTFTLQYSSSPLLDPLARREDCTSSFVCSPSVLKQWTDHFHGGGGQGGSGIGGKGTEEVSIWFKEGGKIRLKSIENRDEGPEVIVPKSAAFRSSKIRPNGADGLRTDTDIFAKGARQMSTLLTVSTAEFDEYAVPMPHLVAPGGGRPSGLHATPIRDPLLLQPLITFPLKEFRAILEVSAALGSAPLDAAFTKGGAPLMITLRPDNVTIDVVIATSEDDPTGMRKADMETKPNIAPSIAGNGPQPSGSGANARPVRPLSSMPPPPVPARAQAIKSGPAPANGRDKGKARATGNGLFRLPSETPEAEISMELENDDFDPDELAQAEAEAFASSQLRQSSQQASQHGPPPRLQQPHRVLALPSDSVSREGSAAAGREGTTAGAIKGKRPREDEEEDEKASETESEDDGDESQLKATQRIVTRVSHARASWSLLDRVADVYRCREHGRLTLTEPRCCMFSALYTSSHGLLSACRLVPYRRRQASLTDAEVINPIGHPDPGSLSHFFLRFLASNRLPS